MENKPKIDCIIDIGACVGLFTDDCLSRYDVTKIYAFEPLPANYEYLVKKYQGNPRVAVFNQAVSNFNGQAPLYKKRYVKKWWNVLPLPRYDFAGNAGSSLKQNKWNVSSKHAQMVQVVTVSYIWQTLNLTRVDILKIDSEGSEYEIFQDLLQSNLYQHIKKIYYEDHADEIAGLENDREKFAEAINNLGIEKKFYLQNSSSGNHLAYVPYQELQSR